MFSLTIILLILKTKKKIMEYSPKLKNAMLQIKNILDANDIAGVVVLHTPGYGEHLIKIDPSYSAAKIEHLPNGEEAIRVKIKTKETGKAKAKQLSEDTTNMFHILTSLTLPKASILMDTSECLDKHYNADHTGKGGSSHQSQNN